MGCYHVDAYPRCTNVRYNDQTRKVAHHNVCKYTAYISKTHARQKNTNRMNIKVLIVRMSANILE